MGGASTLDGFVGFYKPAPAEEDEPSESSEEEEEDDAANKPVDIILAGNKMQNGFVLQEERPGVWAF
jgi:hypothetical protein